MINFILSFSKSKYIYQLESTLKFNFDILIILKMQQFFETIDFSFKYMMIGFNFLTLAMVFFLKRNKKIKKQHHILFVIAHPDDEVMFFGPTLSSLVKDYFVHILCLSGGEIRQQQLKISASNFGIHKFKCLNHDKLIDGMKQKWCQQTIKQEVICYAKQNNIKAFFTFDDKGVSSHPNHKAIYYALSSLQKISQISNEQKKESTKAQEQSKKNGEIYKIYYLQSVNIIRKYSGCIQIIVALLKQFSWLQINVYNAWFSLAIYKSQFVWYRKLWVFFSRYTYINTYRLKKIRIS